MTIKWIDAFDERPENEKIGTLFHIKVNGKERGMFKITQNLNSTHKKSLLSMNDEYEDDCIPISKWVVLEPGEWFWRYIEDDELITFL